MAPVEAHPTLPAKAGAAVLPGAPRTWEWSGVPLTANSMFPWVGRTRWT